MLTALTDRMQALEASQMQIDEDERLRGAIDSGFFLRQRCDAAWTVRLYIVTR